MKRLFLFINLLFLAIICSSQTNVVNNFQLGVSVDTYQSKSVGETPVGVTFPISYGYNYSMGYLCRPTSKLGIELGVGMGKYSYRTVFDLKQKDYGYLVEDYGQIDLNVDENYYSANLGLNYYQGISSKNKLVGVFRCNVMKFARPDKVLINSFASDRYLENYKSLGGISLTTPSNWIFRPIIGIGFERKLKKENSVRLNLLYQTSLKDVIQGEYFIHNTLKSALYKRTENKLNSVKLELLYSISNKKELVGIEKVNTDFWAKKGDFTLFLNHTSTKTIWNLKDPQDSVFSFDKLLPYGGFNAGLEYAFSPKFGLAIEYGQLTQYANISLKSYPIQEWNGSSGTQLKRYSLMAKYYLPLSRRLQFHGIGGVTINETNFKYGEGSEKRLITFEPNNRYLNTEVFSKKYIIPNVEMGIGLDIALFKSITLYAETRYCKAFSPTLYQNITYKTAKDKPEVNGTATTSSSLNMNIGVKLNTGFFYNRVESSTENIPKTKK